MTNEFVNFFTNSLLFLAEFCAQCVEAVGIDFETCLLHLVQNGDEWEVEFCGDFFEARNSGKLLSLLNVIFSSDNVFEEIGLGLLLLKWVK